MAHVNAASRPPFASSIPVPRAASQTRTHTPAASPQLRPRQAGPALSPPRASSSPRLGRAGAGSPKPGGAGREPAEGADSGSPWSSPRVTPKAALPGPAGARRAGETQGAQGRRKGAREGIPVRQAPRGRSPARTSPPRGTPVPPGTPDGSDRRDRPGRSGVSAELEAGTVSGACSPARSPGPSRRPSPAPGAIISFSPAHQHSPPVTATVAPFQYR